MCSTPLLRGYRPGNINKAGTGKGSRACRIPQLVWRGSAAGLPDSTMSSHSARDRVSPRSTSGEPRGVANPGAESLGEVVARESDRRGPREAGPEWGLRRGKGRRFPRGGLLRHLDLGLALARCGSCGLGAPRCSRVGSDPGATGAGPPSGLSGRGPSFGRTSLLRSAKRRARTVLPQVICGMVPQRPRFHRDRAGVR